MRTRSCLSVGLATALLGCAIFAAGAQAAFSTTPTRTIPIGGFYSPGFDGTFWTVASGGNTGAVGHYDDEGNDLGDGFTFPYNSFYPLDSGYYGGRVFITHASSYGKMFGVAVGGDHDIVGLDSETNNRFGGNQMPLRVTSGGGAYLGFGQNNKVGILNLAGGSKDHPWYPQTFFGVGINTLEGKAFETCAVGSGTVVGGEPPKCGIWSGYANEPNGFNYPIDVAPGPGGVYVAEYQGHRVSYVNLEQPGAQIQFRFGLGPGSGAGQIDAPQSVAVQPGTNNVFVSDAGNRRISIFNSAGGFIAAFGYGVLNGADEMQVCGVEIGACQAGVDYKVDPRSYFSQLDFGPEGELYAYMPVTHQIQVFSVGDAPGGGPVPGGPSGPPAPTKELIRLAAAPLKVKKGKKTKLTATVNRGTACANRTVRFQKKDGKSWDNLGKAVKPAKKCKVTKKAKVTEKAVFRAVLINPANGSTLANSPNVTVKLKLGS